MKTLYIVKQLYSNKDVKKKKDVIQMVNKHMNKMLNFISN